MKTRKIFLRLPIAAAIALLSQGAAAQSLDENLTVDGKYKADYIAADRLPSIPSAIALTSPESRLEFDRRGVTANFAPDALSMPATGWRARQEPNADKGYVALSLGSWLNASLSAGYAAIDNDRTRLNAWLQHCSTSLWRPQGADASGGALPRRYVYDETIGADLRHAVGTSGTIEADLRYNLAAFNYYGPRPLYYEGPENPGQTLNDVYTRVHWASSPAKKFSYTAYADFRYFGYKMTMVQPAGPIDPWCEVEGTREKAINAGGSASYAFNANSRIGAELEYSGVFNTETLFLVTDRKVNRAMARPGYDVEGTDWSLHVGAELAYTSGWHDHFRVAPDVRFDARKGNLALSASIGGGTQLRTAAWAHGQDYYAAPGYACTEAAYSPIDARLALQLNPGGKFTAGIDFGWRSTLDETLDVWHISWWQGWQSSPRPYNSRLQGFTLGINAGYELSRWFGLKTRASWQPQHGERGYFNGLDRAALTLTAEAASRPSDRLDLHLAYSLRAKRYLLPGSTLSNLDFNATYRISRHMAVGIELRNLLNRHQMTLPGILTEGITASAGFQLTF